MNLWQGITLLLVGFAAGLFLGAKFGNVPNKYSFGKVKARGEGNEITSVIKPAVTTETKKKRFRIFKRKNRKNEAQ
jgi:hypothetical protein